MQTSKLRREAAALIGLVILTGCDPIYGVQSTGAFPADLNIACVTTALADDPAFANAKRIKSDDARQNGQAARVYGWAYGENNLAILQLTQRSGIWGYSNSMQRMHDHPPEAQIDRFVPPMMRINTVLEKQCGLRVFNQTRS